MDGEQDKIEGGQLKEASGWLPRFELLHAGWYPSLGPQTHEEKQVYLQVVR